MSLAPSPSLNCSEKIRFIPCPRGYDDIHFDSKLIFHSCKRKMFSLTTKLTRINFKQTFYICQREKGAVCFEMKVHLLKWPSISRIIRNPSATFLDSFLSLDNEMFVQRLLELTNKEVFSEKSCFKNFAHPLSEKENIKK